MSIRNFGWKQLSAIVAAGFLIIYLFAASNQRIFATLDQPLSNLSYHLQADSTTYRNKNTTISQAQIMETFCSQHSEELTNKLIIKHFYYSDKFKLVYCYVPKVGCTALKTTMKVLNGELPANQTNYTRGSIHRMLDSSKLIVLSEKEREWRLKTYFKFMFVRDPIERMLSAYFNKLEHPLSPRVDRSVRNEVVKHLSKLLNVPVNNFTKTATLKNGKTYRVIPFQNYLEYLTKSKLQEMDQHFTPMYQLCNPCYVRYNFYGYFGNLTQDVHTLLDLVHAPQWAFPHSNEHADVSVRDFMDVYFKDLSVEERQSLKAKLFKLTGHPFDVLPDSGVSRELLKSAFDIYATDYEFYRSLFPDTPDYIDKYFPQHNQH